jgi:uncharacterized membrane protein YfcA
MYSLNKEAMDFSAFVASLIILFAFYVRSVTGFGSALISIPLLALLFDLKFVVPLECIFEVILSIILLPKIYRKVDTGNLTLVIIGAGVGSLVGIHILEHFTNVILKQILGFAVLAFAVSLFFEGKKEVNCVSKKWGIIAGVAGGISGGMFGASGPAFVIYLSHQIREKYILRATLIGLFAVDYTWRLCVFIGSGLLTLEGMKFALLLLPACILGTVLGHLTHSRISEKGFRQWIAILLAISGILCIIF